MGNAVRFLKITLTLAAVAVGGVAVLNAVVDPKALWSPAHGEFERTEQLENGGRLNKTERLARGDWQAVILGSSRCLRGLDPAHVPGLRTYNACLPAAKVLEVIAMGRYALAQNPDLRLAIIGLDFDGFNARRGLTAEFKNTRAGGQRPFELAMNYVISFDTLSHSLDTVTATLSGERATLGDDGFADWSVRPPTAPPRKRFDAVLTETFLVDPANFGAYRYGRDRVDALRDLLKLYRAAHIRTLLYISPMHARLVEAIYGAGAGKQYETWLRDMATVVSEGGAGVLYDFGGYNSVTMDPVPPPGDHHEMRWYWEPSHFRREVGDLMLARMFGQPMPAAQSGFGRRLMTPADVAAGIAALHAGRARYAREQPFEVSEVVRLVAKTRPRRIFLRRVFPDSDVPEGGS